MSWWQDQLGVLGYWDHTQEIGVRVQEFVGNRSTR